MTPQAEPTRRMTLRTACGLCVALLAGCTDSGSEEPSDVDHGGTEGADATDGDSDGGRDRSSDLDLREANVVEVSIERDGESYRFDVALHHDDDGEDGYANWWQVERLDGTRLGRRELLHAHAEQPFTRSETVEVPGDVSCVVVRGHDRTHGYGGRAMLVDLGSGESHAVEQGEGKRSFERADCP